MTKFSWDRADEKGTSFQGWRMQELLTELLETAANTNCEQCAPMGDCIHNAARAVLSLKRIVEHPPDCPDCKRIHGKVP